VGFEKTDALEQELQKKYKECLQNYKQNDFENPFNKRVVADVLRREKKLIDLMRTQKKLKNHYETVLSMILEVLTRN